jgi:hypothetical protein
MQAKHACTGDPRPILRLVIAVSFDIIIMQHKHIYVTSYRKRSHHPERGSTAGLTYDTYKIIFPNSFLPTRS